MRHLKSGALSPIPASSSFEYLSQAPSLAMRREALICSYVVTITGTMIRPITRKPISTASSVESLSISYHSHTGDINHTHAREYTSAHPWRDIRRMRWHQRNFLFQYEWPLVVKYIEDERRLWLQNKTELT